MQSIMAFLTELRQRQIHLWAEGDRVRVKAPEGALTPDLRAQLSARKAEILAFLREAAAATAFSQDSIEPVSREGALPLSFAQERLWILDQFEGPSATYNSTVACRLHGPFDFIVFERAVNEIVRRHEILRTAFVASNGQPAQVISPDITLKIQVVERKTLSALPSDSILQNVLLAETQQTFNLASAPLVRVTCVNMNENDVVLIVVMHHIISDGWSGHVFTKELAALYKAFSKGQESPLPDLLIQYVDFAIWERKQLQGERLESQLAYWKDRLSGVPASLELPTDFPRPEQPTYNGTECRLLLPHDLSHELQAFSARNEVTLFITLWTVFQILLSAYSGQEDFVVATSDANRDRKEIEPLIGFFINQIVLRSDLFENPDILELLQRVSRNTLAAYAHKHIPFSRLVQELQIERKPDRNPLFQILFILQNFPKVSVDFGPETHAQILEVPVHTSRLDSMITIWNQSDRLEVRWEYSTDLFHETTIRLLLETYRDFLAKAIHHPERRVSDFSLPEPLRQRIEHARQLHPAQHAMLLHHLGFACRDIHKGLRFIRQIYAIKQIGDILYDDLQDVQVCLIETRNNIRLELIAGRTVEHLVQQGVTLYQMCYEVPDIFQAIQQFQAQGAALISEPKPAKLFENRLVAFLNTELGLVELLETTPSQQSLEVVRKFQTLAPQIPRQTIAIAATFTADPIQEALEFWMHTLRRPSDIVFAPYNQIFQELLQPASLFGSNTDGLNVALLRFEDWERSETSQASIMDRDRGPQGDMLARNVHDFIQALRASLERSGVPHVVCLCPASPAAIADSERRARYDHLQATVVSECRQMNGVYPLTFADIVDLYPVAEYYDAQAERAGQIPFTAEFFTALGTMVARRFHAITHAPYKVIVLDCDGTLWKGVCGEDGPAGIAIPEPYTALQEFMLAQYQAGMLLCLASKNAAGDVLNVFEQRRDMRLTANHFVAMRINWRPKSENIMALAEELQLGLESFIFVDDNPVECAEVRANCPSVLTVQLPAETESIPEFLRHFWAFDHARVTHEDARRTEMYRQNIEREHARQQAPTLNDFLSTLDLRVVIAPMKPEQLARVSQLTYRTNQFNTTTRRRSEHDIHELCSVEGYECFITEVSDRFGDYGLVGVMFVQMQPDVLVVETLLLSCRALGRGVEHRMLAYAGALCRERGLDALEVQYIPSAQNTPAHDFLQGAGASSIMPQKEGISFYFPAEGAAALSYQPLTEAPQASPQARAKRAPSPLATPPSSSLSDRFTDIAATLTRPSEILRAIQARTMRARPEQAEGFIAPRTPVETELAEIWRDLLRIKQVGVYDNFFHIGGNSLLAAQCMARIHQKFSVELPLRTLLSAPTIALLADAILARRAENISDTPPAPELIAFFIPNAGNPVSRSSGTSSPSWSPLVAIQPNGIYPPLFAVHPGGGNVLCYSKLSQYLGAEYPFYGLQARGFEQGQRPLERIEDMAAAYLDALRTVRSQGPYWLLGWSFGGLVAFEMAQQLHAQNQEVGFLGLLDTSSPLEPDRMFPERALTDSDADVLLDVLELDKIPGSDLAALRAQLAQLDQDQQLLAILDEGRRVYPLPDSIDAAAIRRFVNVLRTENRALRNYVVRPYFGPITYFQGKDSDITCEWEEFTGHGVTIHLISGNHHSMMIEPNVRTLAEHLRACLMCAYQEYENAPLADHEKLV